MAAPIQPVIPAMQTLIARDTRDADLDHARTTTLQHWAESATFSRNHELDPVQPTRSAITVAGVSGCSANNPRIRGSNTANDDLTGVRTYLGGASELTAFTTVVRETPSLTAIRACGSPSAASLLISAQSSKVITLRSSSSGHFSPAKSFSLRPAPTEPPRDRFGQIKSGQTAALHAPAAAGGVLASDPDRLIRFHP